MFVLYGGIQNHWVCGLCPSSGILNNQKKTTFQKLDLFAALSDGGETPTLLSPLETADLNNWI
jgi:hypothetical protein